MSSSRPAPILADSFEELHDVAEAIESEQQWGISHCLWCRCTSIIG